MQMTEGDLGSSDASQQELQLVHSALSGISGKTQANTFKSVFYKRSDLNSAHVFVTAAFDCQAGPEDFLGAQVPSVSEDNYLYIHAVDRSPSQTSCVYT